MILGLGRGLGDDDLTIGGSNDTTASASERPGGLVAGLVVLAAVDGAVMRRR